MIDVDEKTLADLRVLATGGGMNITTVRNAIELIERLTQWQADTLAWMKEVGISMTPQQAETFSDLLVRAGEIDQIEAARRANQREGGLGTGPKRKIR